MVSANHLFPYLQSSINAKSIKKSLKNLLDNGLITPSEKRTFQPNDFSIALTEGLLPIISFGSCAISTSAETGLHIGFVIGLNVNLAIKATSEKDVQSIQITGMDGVQLSRLLFELGIPSKE